MTNQFAAVPSFHVGWNLLVAIAVWRASRFRPLKALALVSPMLMITAVVLTANHWLLDIVAGIAVAIVGITAAHFMDRLFCRFRPAALDDDEHRCDPAAEPEVEPEIVRQPLIAFQRS